MLSETAGSPSTTAEVLFKVIHAQYDALYQPPGGTRIWPNEQTLRPDGKASTHAVRTIDAPYWNGIALDVTKDSLIKYIPTRSEVRGKIVFMGPDSVPADAVAYGYPAGSKAGFYPDVFSVQDNYRITETKTLDAKWNEDWSRLYPVIDDRPPGKFYFTWLNAATDLIVLFGPTWAQNPSYYASNINRWAIDYIERFRGPDWGRYGSAMLDCPGPRLIDTLIGMNFKFVTNPADLEDDFYQLARNTALDITNSDAGQARANRLATIYDNVAAPYYADIDTIVFSSPAIGPSATPLTVKLSESSTWNFDTLVSDPDSDLHVMTFGSNDVTSESSFNVSEVQDYFEDIVDSGFETLNGFTFNTNPDVGDPDRLKNQLDDSFPEYDWKVWFRIPLVTLGCPKCLILHILPFLDQSK